ncbi:DUF1615 domain-containing protein [Paludibacterium sp.]|uniref:DUF1615 domain-containing protein n=1 Tax=Paludibacterium sp. TaxID=1917523 RepID=UPI0025F05CE3|nr:DUF1615 domain-containing protein [Paludibacterium sp.]MBV8646792.1 DUF1615 domain-containing protein [Paludibacterium sp.]
MSLRHAYFLLAAPLILTACASAPTPAPSASAPVAAPLPASAPAVEPAPVPVQPAVTPPPAPSRPTTPPQPNYNNPQAGRALLDTLLPRGIPSRKAWSDNVFAAFTQLKIPYAPQYFCAVLAVAQQESDFNPDPPVPNLSAIVWKEIDDHRKKYMIPQFVIDAAMLKTSPDGHSYKERVNSLRTKRQMNQLYEDMVRELPYGQQMLQDKNPIRDGGPMQVSVAFAQTQIRAWPYPYSYGNLRDEVFSLRGSVYFGTAILLQYAAPYDQMIYRFADYNAGRYSSRNAAFQAAVARLAGRKLALDGDLMLYKNKMDRIFSGQPSETQTALMAMTGRLQMSGGDIVRDLKQEKLSTFEQTVLYQRVFAAADRLAGRRVPREMIPQIVLVSPKFTHRLTTEWFATRVNDHYRQCMARGGFKAD